MGKVIIINGSPRAPRSNSKEYGEIFRSYYKGQADTFNITKNNHKEICSKIQDVYRYTSCFSTLCRWTSSYNA